MRLNFPCVATIAAILLVSQVASAGALFPRVLVTVAPLKPYVDQILLGQGESTNLLRAGQDPHNFALTLPQAEMLDKADIIIVPDLSMNPFLRTLLAKKPHAHVIELSALDGAAPLPYASENPWLAAMKKAQPAPKPTDHNHPDAHAKPAATEDDDDTPAHDVTGDNHHPLTDPHLWLDPERMAAIATPLARAIADQAPESHATLALNARTLTTHLRRDVIPAMRLMLDKKATTITAMQRPEIPFVTYHAAYQYFLSRFGLTHYGEIITRPEDAMGGKSLATVLRGADAVHLNCLIGEQENVLMRRIASSSGAKIVVLSPEQLPARKDVDALDWIQTDYDRFLYVTAKTFSRCL